MKIFITGGAGTCGSVLKDIKYDKVFFDLKSKPKELKNLEYIKGNLMDKSLLSKNLSGCDILIHLAAKDYYPDFKMSSGEVSWDDYCYNNIDLTKQLFEIAIENNIKKIIFASTHRVQGMYEKKYAPKIYNLGHQFKFDHKNDVCPDSIYAVSKLFGENLAKYYSIKHNIDFKCIRICSVRDKENDNPLAYAEYGYHQGLWKRNSKEYIVQSNRLKGLWQSRRDFLQMIEKIIQSKKKGFEIFYGLSNNDRSWFDLKYSQDSLNYNPQDNAESY
tara:strand:- start:447 stop:1268 length:822 start_codon:yes stop_codon:yes gene_type:complete